MPAEIIKPTIGFIFGVKSPMLILLEGHTLLNLGIDSCLLMIDGCHIKNTIAQININIEIQKTKLADGEQEEIFRKIFD